MTTSLIEQLYAEMKENRERTREAEFRADQAEYEVYLRAKYSTQDKKDLLKAGKAMANPNGDPSYPIADTDDLQKAIHAVGRGSADHDDIRKHIIKNAKKLGKTSMIPDNWDMDTGELKESQQSNDGEGPGEIRDDDDTKQCPTCNGTGTILQGNRKCPTCNGNGKVASDYEAKSDETALLLAVATWITETNREMTFNINHEPSYRDAPADADDRIDAHREQYLLRELKQLPEEQREEMIASAPDPDGLRAAVGSYSDIENAVEDALSQVYGERDQYCDLWVCDAGDDGADKWAVFQSYVDPPGNGTWKVTFNCADNGSITFTSDPVPVARVTTYEEVPQEPVPSLMAMTMARDADLLALEHEADQDSEIRAKVMDAATDDDGDDKSTKKAAKSAKKAAKKNMDQ